MNIFFSVFPIMFILVFGLVISIFVMTFVREFRRHKSDNASPRLTVEAKVVGKRQNFRHSNEHGHTSYFVTFEVESGDRLELQMDGAEYGMLIEGDRGKLTFQGSRYLKFERIR